MKSIVILIMLLLIPTQAAAFNEIGFDLFFGRSRTSLNQEIQSSEWEYQAIGGLFKTGKYLNRDWGLRADAGFQYRYHRASNSERTRYGHDVGIELSLVKEFLITEFITPYLGIAGGFSAKFPGGQPRFSNSGFLGNIGALIGYKLPISADWKIKWELRWTHSSDPIRTDDPGRDWEEVRFGFVREF